MKKNEIKSFRRDMFKAKFAYHNAIVQKLKECGKELDVVSEYWDEDEDYPRGVHLTSLNDDNEAFDVVVDKIRYEDREPVSKLGIHICRYEYKDVDYWWGINDLMEECADYVFSSIVWEDNDDSDSEFELDKRLQLTDEQLVIINRYNNAVKDLLESGVHCVFFPFEEIGAFNGKDVDEVCFEEDAVIDNGDLLVPFESLPNIACPFGLNLTFQDSNFCVRLKK